VELTLASQAGGEEGDRLVVTLQLSAASDEDVSVPFTLGGSAEVDLDYASVDSPITIPAGRRRASLAIEPIDDLLDEDDETVVLTLGSPDGASLGAITQHTATLEDDDATPTVTFTDDAQSGPEGGAALVVTAQLSAVSGRDVTLPLVITGTAGDPEDYGIDSSPLVIPAGSLRATRALTPIQDALDEDDETVVLTLAAPVNATLGERTAYTATFLDDDATPTLAFSAAGQTVAEDRGSATLTLALSAISGRDVSVPLTTGGTASEVEDYGWGPSPLILPAGTQSLEIPILLIDDLLHEEDETAVFTLGAPTHATLGGTAQHTLTLRDQDAPPDVSFGTSSTTVDEFQGSETIVIELSATAGLEVTVPFTVSGSAGDPEDYGLTPSPVVIPAGESSTQLVLSIVDDALDEEDETVVLTLGTPRNASLGIIDQRTVTLTDDDSPPSVEFELLSQSPGEGVGNVQVGVRLSEASGLDVTVPFTLGGDARDPEDYSAPGEELVIDAGSTEGLLQFAIVDDALPEGDETIELLLETPAHATLGAQTSHTVTLQDDDPPPSVSFAQDSLVASEGAGQLAIGVVLSHPSGLDVSVPYTITGTATSPDDFSVDASPLVIPAGAPGLELMVAPVDDFLYEGDEAIEITLGEPTNATLGAIPAHTLTLTSDDPPPTLSFVDESQSVGEGLGQAAATLQLSVVSGTDVLVPLFVSGSATADKDFALEVNPVAIPQGMLTAEVPVALIADALHEADETVILTLGVPTGAEAGATAVHVLTVSDDDPPPSVGFKTHFQIVEESAGLVGVGVSLSAVSGLDVTVPFYHTGTAEPGADYTISASPLVIPAGSLSQEILVTVVDDGEKEFTERVHLWIDSGGLSNASPGALIEHRLRIKDDEFESELRIPGLRTDVQEFLYPQVRVGESDGPRQVVVTNTQELAIELTGVVLEGEHPEDYSVTPAVPLPVELLPGDSVTFEVDYAPQEGGPRNAVARLVQSPTGDPPSTVDLQATALGPRGAEVVMNAGPDEYVDLQERFWARDHGCTGASAYLTYGGDLPGSGDDPLYAVARVGTAFGYCFPLPDGAYDVTLHFAELEATGALQRVFDVSLEGILTLDDLDLAVVAGPLVPWDSGPLRVDVTGGQLEIDFDAVVGEALVAAIEVRSVPLLESDATTLDFGSLATGEQGHELLTVTNAGLADAELEGITFLLDETCTGSGCAFQVQIDGVTYSGGSSTVDHEVALTLPAGEALEIPVSFSPAESGENRLRFQLRGDFTTLEVVLIGTGTTGKAGRTPR